MLSVLPKHTQLLREVQGKNMNSPILYFFQNTLDFITKVYATFYKELWNHIDDKMLLSVLVCSCKLLLLLYFHISKCFVYYPSS